MIPDIMDGISLSIISLAKDKNREAAGEAAAAIQHFRRHKTPAQTQD